MDVVILAAGLGTRLRPHTETTPKPLLHVQGRPILDWIIGTLPPVERLIVVTNYLAEQIDAYLTLQTHVPKSRCHSVRQNEPRGTGDALMSCRDTVVSDRVMVLNGDDLYGRADIQALSQCEAGLLAHPVDEPSKFGIVFRKDDGTLAELKEKPQMTGRQLANIGAYMFPRSVFDLELPLSPRNEYEITDAVSMIAMKQPFRVIPATFWFPIGDVPAWEAAQKQDLIAVK